MPDSIDSEITVETFRSDQPEVSRPIGYVPPLPVASAIWKRTLDIAVSCIMLILAFPVMVVVAIVVRITSSGPVIYKAKRVGLSGKPFLMFKFRSMYVDADTRVKELWAQNDHAGPVFKIRKDPRITPVGKFLRKYSLDELPQFLNVLTGDMSLVGPRALHDYEIEKFDDHARERLAVKPGITCYWQIMGRSRLSFEEWVELDHRYMRDASFATDVKILWDTPRAVLKSDGAF